MSFLFHDAQALLDAPPELPARPLTGGAFPFDTRDAEPPVPTETSRGRRTGVLENLVAAFDEAFTSGTTASEAVNKARARRERAEAVEKVSGKSFRETIQPFSPRPGEREFDNYQAIRDDIAVDRWLETVPERQRNGILPSAMLEARAREIALEHVAEAQSVQSRAHGGWATAAGFGGAAAGYMTDPLNIAGLAFGAPLASGVVRTALVEAGIAAVTQTGVEIINQPYRESLGLPSGLDRALGNVALTAAGAGLLGGAFRGVPLAGRALAERFRGAGVRGSESDLAAALDHMQAHDDLMHANPFDGGAAGRSEHQWRALQVDEALANGAPLPDFPGAGRFHDELLGSTALSRSLPGETAHLPAELPASSAAADALPARSMIAAAPDGAARRFATEAEALAVAGRARKRSGLDLQPVELEDGSFALARETDAAPLRRPDGTPLTFETERAARRFIDSAAVTKGRDLEAVPYAPDGGQHRFAIVEGASADDLSAMRSDPSLTRFAAGEDNSAMTGGAGLRAQTRADNLNALADALRTLPAAADRGTGRRAAGFADAVEAAAHAVRRGEDPSLALEGLGRAGTAADAPPRWRFDNSGDRPVVTLRGDELGAVNTDLKALRAAASEIYARLKAAGPARHPELGDILFTAKGWRKLQSNSADRRTLQLVPALRDLIERSQHLNTEAARTTRADGIVRFHWLEAPVRLGNEDLRVGIQIAEDVQGRKFYNLNRDVAAWERAHGEMKTPGGTHLPNNAELRQGLGDNALQENIGSPAAIGKAGAFAREGLRREAEADLVRFDRPGGAGTQSHVRSLATDLSREIQRDGDFDVPLGLDAGGEAVRTARASDLLRDGLDDRTFLDVLKGCLR